MKIKLLANKIQNMKNNQIINGEEWNNNKIITLKMQILLSGEILGTDGASNQNLKKKLWLKNQNQHYHLLLQENRIKIYQLNKYLRKRKIILFWKNRYLLLHKMMKVKNNLLKPIKANLKKMLSLDFLK